MRDDSPLVYDTKLFKPKTLVHRPAGSSSRSNAADQRVAPVYVYDDGLVLAINVALATRRPMLIRGPSGCGKSSLARNVADVKGWRYYEQVITSRTEARELLWQVDLLRRLHAAQAGKGLDESFAPYIKPGVLWWAFDPDSAKWRGQKPETPGITPLRDPSRGIASEGAVVLLDEIDKADPEVPNNLLVPLGSLYFEVEEIDNTPVRADAKHAPLVIITTNDERELPKAFLRRCVEVKIDWPTRARLVDIAAAHFPKMSRKHIKATLEALVGAAGENDGSKPVELSPAEFNDTIQAIDDLGVSPGGDSEEWKSLARMTIWKHGREPVGS